MNGRSPLFIAAKMNHVDAVNILLINMSNAFAMDREGTKIEETTCNPEVLRLISKGKMVITKLNKCIVLMCDEVCPAREEEVKHIQRTWT